MVPNYKLPRHALLDCAKAPRLGLLTGRGLDRSTCACHEFHTNNVRRKTKAAKHAKMSAPAELQLARQGTGQSWSEQPSTSDRAMLSL